MDIVDPNEEYVPSSPGPPSSSSSTPYSNPPPNPPPISGGVKKRGRTTGGPATRQAAQALGLIGNQPVPIAPTRSRAYQYVYRAHHGASKGLTAKQIRHLYRYRPKRKVSAATRDRIRAMGKINGPALKLARAAAKREGRKMNKQDFYIAGGMQPKAPQTVVQRG